MYAYVYVNIPVYVYVNCLGCVEFIIDLCKHFCN